MKHPLLFLAAGLLGPVHALAIRLGLSRPQEIPDDVSSLLAREAEAFLRAGGTIDLRAWRGLTMPERAALVVAGDRIRTDEAATAGWASQSPGHALQVQGILDGGASNARLRRQIDLQIVAEEVAARRGPEGVRR